MEINSVNDIRAQNMEFVFIWQVNGYTKVYLDEIIWLKAARSYCEIYLDKKDKILVSWSLSEVINALESDRFVRIHRSYAVNLKFVDSFTGNSITLSDRARTRLLIGREHRNNLFGRFKIIGSKNKKIK